jgi:hypothetical protein
MKRLIQIIALIFVALIIVSAVSLYPKFENMKSEYDTAQAIRDIEVYLRENQGSWPRSPEQLGNKYLPGGKVVVDYSASSGQLIASPNTLRSAVRPRSGKFYTYPHYDWQIDDLLLVLRETNNSEQAVAPNRSLPPTLNSTSSVRGSED